MKTLEPLKKLEEDVENYIFELNQTKKLMEENDIRLKKEIERLNKENILLENKIKQINEYKTKSELELKSKD